MQSPTPARVIYGLFAGLILLLFAAWSSGATGTICEYNQGTHQNQCSSYGLAVYVLVKAAEFLNFYGALITAIATIAIAAFTFTLKRSTDRLWEAGEKQFNHAKSLAFQAFLDRATDLKNVGQQIQLARNEFLATHRPKVIVREVYLDGDQIWFRLVNVGDTPATIAESSVTAEIVTSKAGLRPLLSTGKNDLGTVTLAAGELRELSYRPHGDLGFSFASQMGDRKVSMFIGDRYFTGTVIYVDEIGIRRRSVFRRKWQAGERRFVRLDPEEERDNEYAD
jgi:hypothetical protein